MKVSGEKSFQAPRSVVWEVLNDPARMAKLMPGIESFDIQDERNWSAKVKVPLGLGALPLSFAFEKTDERAPEYARLAAKGKGVGAIVSMDTQFHLNEASSGTAMQWEAEVSIAGPVGSMGQRVLQPIVSQQVQHVLTSLDTQVREAVAHDDSPRMAPTSEGPKDYGPPAETTPAADPPSGSSGAEEGVSPWAPEAYEPEPEGPTTSTEDKG